MRVGTTIAVMVLATGVMCGSAVVAEDTPPTEATKPEGTAPAQPKLGAKPKAPMSVIPFKQIELKPEHALLKGLVGHWTTKVHIYEGQFANARDAAGTADGKALLGGLFVQLTHTETRNKQPFEGMALYGYNEALNKYTADQMDTTGTAVLHFVGTYDAATKELAMSTHYTDEKMKNLKVGRSVTKLIDEKNWTYEEWVSPGVGKPEKRVVSIAFTRP